MVKSNSIVFFVFILTFISTRAAEASSGENLPSANEVVSRMLEVLKIEEDSDPKFTFKKKSTEQDLDSDGKPDETNHVIYEMVLLDGKHPYERMIKKNGADLNAEEREKEKEREKEARKRIAEEKDEDTSMGDLAARFVFKMIGLETLDGRSTFVLTFKPDKTKDLPEDEDYDPFINALHGKLWIDAQDFAVAKIVARLGKTVRVGLGFLATLNKVNLTYQRRKSSGGDWLPHKNRTYVWGRTMVFKPIRYRESASYYDFKSTK